MVRVAACANLHSLALKPGQDPDPRDCLLRGRALLPQLDSEGDLGLLRLPLRTCVRPPVDDLVEVSLEAVLLDGLLGSHS